MGSLAKVKSGMDSSMTKKGELRIFKTRKEIKDTAEEDKTSPPNKKNEPSNERRIPERTTKTFSNIGSPIRAKKNENLAPKTTTKPTTAKATPEKTVSSSPRRKSLLPTTVNPKPAAKNPMIRKQNSQPEKSEVAKVIRNIEEKIKAKSLSPVKNRKRNEKGPTSSMENLAKTGSRIYRRMEPEKASRNGDGSAVVGKGKKNEAHGKDSEERVSQTVDLKRKSFEGFAEAVFAPKPKVYQCSDYENASMNSLAAKRFSPSDIAANSSRDLFVYLNPQKTAVSATLTLDRPKKLISNSAPSLEKKSNNQSSKLEDSNDMLPSSKRKGHFMSVQTLNTFQPFPSPQKSANSIGSSGTLLVPRSNLFREHAQPLSEEDISQANSVSSSTLNSSLSFLNHANVSDGIGASCTTLPKFPRGDSPTHPVSEIHTTFSNVKPKEANDGSHIAMNKENKSSKLADKLSRSFFDLTQGSQDRLQKWKSKLQQYGHQRGLSLKERDKDTSAPPPRNRRMRTFGGSIPDTDMEIIMDWTNSPLSHNSSARDREGGNRQPRPLRTSYSASNALAQVRIPNKPNRPVPIDELRAMNVVIATNPLHKSHSLRETPYTIRTAAVTANVNAPSLQNISDSMEHRTLKQRSAQTVNGFEKGSEASKDFHRLLQSIEGYSIKESDIRQNGPLRNSNITELPPPARIMPYSGIKPQDNGIIRPIAFRPMNGDGLRNRNILEHRQSMGLELASNFASTGSANGSGLSLLRRAVPNGNIEDYKKTLKEQSRSISNLTATIAPSRPGSNGFRNGTLNHASTSHSASSSHLHVNTARKDVTTVRNEENDYDTVPEFVDHKCLSEAGDSSGNHSETYSSIYPYQNNCSTNAKKPTGANSHVHENGNTAHTFSQNSTLNSRNTSNSSGSSAINRYSPTNGTAKKLQNGQQNYRHSGIHITPSPSDSGIVDYESLIRDKENELSTVRQAMEQNEEVLIRVYQDKERQFKEQIGQLRNKLQASQQIENALRQQLSQSDDIRQQFQKSVQMLTEDRNVKHKESLQLKNDLNSLRLRCNELERALKSGEHCGKCRNDQKNTSLYENDIHLQERNHPPVPAPRSQKDSPSNQELRVEVDDLRGEISGLREQLNQQIHFFTEERQRWEHEKTGIQQSSPTRAANKSVAPNGSTHSEAPPPPIKPKPNKMSSFNGLLGRANLSRPNESKNNVQTVVSNDRLI
ncbi:hypothetical protein Ddc_03174 [Ditylenchus destructor]|nr:hypothetical protein Ddc_03174 [Ditylenchus destructor]